MALLKASWDGRPILLDTETLDAIPYELSAQSIGEITSLLMKYKVDDQALGSVSARSKVEESESM